MKRVRVSTILTVAALVFSILYWGYGFLAWIDPLRFTGFRDLSAGDVVALPNGISLTVPVSFQGLEWRDADSDHYLESVHGMSISPSRTVDASVDKLYMDMGASESSASKWEAIDEQYRSHIEVRLYEPAHSSFAIGNGWKASVTTRREGKLNRPHELLVFANLTKPGASPVRLTASYPWPSTEPSSPPDPASMFAKMRKQYSIAVQQ